MFFLYVFSYHAISISGSRSVLNACFFENEEIKSNETCHRYYPTNYSKFDNEYTAIYNQINFKVYGEINHTFLLANIPLTLLLSINGMDAAAQVTLLFPTTSKLRLAMKDITVTIRPETSTSTIINCNTIELDNVTLTNRRSFSIDAVNVTTTISSLVNISQITSSVMYTLELKTLYVPFIMKVPVDAPNIYITVGNVDAHISRALNHYIMKSHNSSEYISLNIVKISTTVNIIATSGATLTLESITSNSFYRSQALNVLAGGTVVFPHCSWGDGFKFTAELQRDSIIKLYGYTPVSIMTEGNSLVLASFGTYTGIESITHTTTKMITVVMPEPTSRGVLSIRAMSIINSIYFQSDYPNMNVRLGLVQFPTDTRNGKLKLSGQALFSIDSIRFNDYSSEVDVLKFDASGILKVYYCMTKEQSKISCSQCFNRSKMIIYPIVASNISASSMPMFTDVSFLSMIFNGAMNSDISFNFSLNNVQFTTESDNNFEVHSIREGIYDLVLRTDFLYNRFFITDNATARAPLNTKKVYLENYILPLAASQLGMKELQVIFGQLNKNTKEFSLTNILGPVSIRLSSTETSEDHITIWANPIKGYSTLVLEKAIYNFDRTPESINVLELRKGARLNTYKVLEIANHLVVEEDLLYTIPSQNTFNDIKIISTKSCTVELNKDNVKFGSETIRAKNITIETEKTAIEIKSCTSSIDYSITIIARSISTVTLTGNFPNQSSQMQIIGTNQIDLILNCSFVPFYIKSPFLQIDTKPNSSIHFHGTIRTGKISTLDKTSSYHIQNLLLESSNLIGSISVPNSRLDTMSFMGGYFDISMTNVSVTTSENPDIFIIGNVGWGEGSDISIPYKLATFPIVNVTSQISRSLNLRMVYKGTEEDMEVRTMIDNKAMLKRGINFFCGEYIECQDWNMTLESDSVEYFSSDGAVSLDCVSEGIQQCVRFRFLDNIAEPLNEAALIGWVLGSICVVALLGFLSGFATHFYQKRRLEKTNLIFRPIL